MYEITRTEMRKDDKENDIWWINYEKKQTKIEAEHDIYRVKFMEMLVKKIPNSKHIRGIGGIYRYITIPFLKIFRKKICGVYRQWNYDWSLGINLYDKRYYKIIKKILQNFDDINGSNSTIFKEYE